MPLTSTGPNQTLRNKRAVPSKETSTFFWVSVSFTIETSNLSVNDNSFLVGTFEERARKAL